MLIVVLHSVYKSTMLCGFVYFVTTTFKVFTIEFGSLCVSQCKRMTREALDVCSDKSIPGWTMYEHQSASVSINQDQLGSFGDKINQMSLTTKKSDLWWSTLSSLRQYADSNKEAPYLVRFLKVTWRLHFIYENTTGLFFRYVWLTLMWNKYQT